MSAADSFCPAGDTFFFEVALAGGPFGPQLGCSVAPQRLPLRLAVLEPPEEEEAGLEEPGWWTPGAETEALAGRYTDHSPVWERKELTESPGDRGP